MLNLNIIKNSTILVRVNYDLPLQGYTARIRDSLNTIETLLSNNNKVILVSHWGRPKGKVEAEFSTNKITGLLYEQLQSSNKELLINASIEYLDQYQNFKEAAEYIRNTDVDKNNSKIFLLENTRFHPMEKSKNSENRLNLAKQYAILADVFVDEAFAVSHRQEATNSEIKSILPYALGHSYESELSHLSKLKENPKKPFYIIMAGSKLKTKLELITNLLEKSDKILLGGMLCFTFLKAKQELYPDLDLADTYDSEIETDFIDKAKKLLLEYPEKIVLPKDFTYTQTEGKKLAMDIGPQTVDFYSKQISHANTIFWNGTLGYYEKPPFDQGTLQLAKSIANLKYCYKVIGGGDTNSALPRSILQTFNFASMGGGATLNYLSQN
ncbi:MAG: phosphoglycerate kinase [Patescibacteria group bacterium]